jgi:hypothetical protein
MSTDDTPFQQGRATDAFFQQAIDIIDRQFGEGYSRANPNIAVPAAAALALATMNDHCTQRIANHLKPLSLITFFPMERVAKEPTLPARPEKPEEQPVYD